MKLSWDLNETAYHAAYREIAKRYPDIVGWSGSFVVQLEICSGNHTDNITTLLIDNRDCGGDPEQYEWETDWWEGEKDVYLIGVAPVSDIDLSKHWSVDENEEEV